MTEPRYCLEFLLGSVKIESRMRRDGNKLIGEGRSLHYDQHGMLTETTEWEPSGIALVMSDERTTWQRFCDWLL